MRFATFGLRSFLATGLFLTFAVSAAAQEPPAEVELAAGFDPAEHLEVVDGFWRHLTALCGQAFEGKVVSDDPVDAALAAETLTMHVRRCTDDRIEVPFHVGGDRSRTWVLTRDGAEVVLRHDHRHEDGSHDAVTQYGGASRGHLPRRLRDVVHGVAQPGEDDTSYGLLFPADTQTQELFRAQGLEASVTNLWTMTVEPGRRFVYALDRENRSFRADFDLTRPVEPPPAPWGGYEETEAPDDE